MKHQNDSESFAYTETGVQKKKCTMGVILWLCARFCVCVYVEGLFLFLLFGRVHQTIM